MDFFGRGKGETPIRDKTFTGLRARVQRMVRPLFRGSECVSWETGPPLAVIEGLGAMGAKPAAVRC